MMGYSRVGWKGQAMVPALVERMVGEKADVMDEKLALTAAVLMAAKTADAMAGLSVIV